jgi:hypothetical protein
MSRDRPACRGLAGFATLVAAMVVVSSAAAHRPSTKAEFQGIERAVDQYTKHFYCASPGAVDVSTRDSRWAAAFGVSNCGSGSIEGRFYLRRASHLVDRWRVVEVTARHGIENGRGPRCASRRVPADIRCGVRGRS